MRIRVINYTPPPPAGIVSVGIKYKLGLQHVQYYLVRRNTRLQLARRGASEEEEEEEACPSYITARLLYFWASFGLGYTSSYTLP